MTKAIELGGAEGVTYGLLGYCHLNLGNHVSAEAAYKNAVLHDPGQPRLEARADQKLHRRWASTGPPRNCSTNSIQSHPDKPNLWVLQANVYLQQEQPLKATVNLEALRRLGLATAQDLALLGDLHMAQESTTLALSAYLESMEKDDGSRSGRALRTAEIRHDTGLVRGGRGVVREAS